MDAAPSGLPFPQNPAGSRLRWGARGLQRFYSITCILDLRSSWYVFSVDRGLSETEDTLPAGEIGAGQDAYLGRCVRLEMFPPFALAVSTMRHPHFFFPVSDHSHLSPSLTQFSSRAVVTPLVLRVPRAAQPHSLGLACPFLLWPHGGPESCHPLV